MAFSVHASMCAGGATPPPDAEVRPPTMGEAVARLGQAAVYMAAPAAESSVSYGSTTVVMYSMVLNLAERTGGSASPCDTCAQ